MGIAIKLVSVLLFLVMLVSVLYSGYSYTRYRGTWSKPDSLGLLSSIRASLRLMHDPHDAGVLEESKKWLRHYQIALGIFAGAMLLAAAIVVMVRLSGVQVV
jgi:hypothetical protein